MRGRWPFTAPGTDRLPILPIVTLLLIAAQAHFLWMFFAAEAVPQAAAAAAADGTAPGSLALEAARFAAQWKHGMTGNSPIYMPGFFAVGLLTWLWSLGRPLRRLAIEWVVLAAAATVVGAWLSPLGAARALRGFQEMHPVALPGLPAGFTTASAGVSLFTLLTWSAGIVCLQRSIARRSVAPMSAPLILNLLLVRLRPGAASEYTSRWVANLAEGDPVAIASLIAVPVLLALVISYQLRSEGVREAAGAAAG
jgi:hypothetical protein